MLYVVSSMEQELYGLRKEFESLESPRGVGFPVEFHTVGIGPRRSGETTASVLSKAKRQPHGVLMLGVAGAVDPGMETGQLLLAGNYAVDSKEDPVSAIAPDPEMLKLAESAAAAARMPVDRNDSLTVNHLIAEVWEREQLRQQYGVASVNMEDHAVATAVGNSGVPFLSVRVVLDTAEQQLPGFLPGLSKGRNAVITEVLIRPWRIPVLLKLKSQMDLCQAVLARFGMSYLQLEAERRRSVREKASAEAIY